MQKNVGGQIWTVFAFDRVTNVPKTGDAANITANLRLDGGVANPVDDTNPDELAGGFYKFNLTQAETNADHIVIIPASTTGDIQVIGVPASVWTVLIDIQIIELTGQVTPSVTQANVLSVIAQDIINDAVRKCGVKDIGNEVSPEEIEIALRMLNSLIKQWESRGVKLHTIYDLEIPQYGSKQSYRLDSTNLITSWGNNSYDSFAFINGDITTAIKTGAGTQTAQTNAISVAIGKQCTLVATWTNVAGQAPTLTGTGGFTTTTLVAGVNTITFAATAASIVITATNTATASWVCTFKMARGDVDISRPMRAISARRRDNATLYETPILLLSREEYKQLTIKSSVGPVTQVSYERQLDYGTLYVWPISDALYATPDYTIILTIQRAIDIFDTAEDAPDLPSEMFLAAVYGLAEILADDYSVDINERKLIGIKAQNYFGQLIMTDQETTSIFFQPETR